MAIRQFYTITIQLTNIHELFTIANSDPFSPHMCFSPGVDLIKSKVKPQLARRKIYPRTIIRLPHASIEPDLPARTHDALTRYCQFKIRQNKETLSTLRRGAFTALIVGILVLAAGVFLSEHLDNFPFLPAFFDTLFSDGFDIAFWVILWRPVDFFLFDLFAYARENAIYQQMMNMEISIVDEHI